MAYPVTLNGRTYTLADFEGTNYVEGLPDAFEDFVTHAGDIYNSTSTTSNSIGTGSKTFTVESAKPYQAGTPLRIADAAAPSTNFMDTIVTSYSGTTLVVDAVGYAGSGTFTSWNVNIGGAASVAGALGIAQGGTGATTAAAARTNLDTYSKSEADSRFLNVSGEASDVTMTGNVTIGDAAGDTLTVNATADFNTGFNVDGSITTDGASLDGAVVVNDAGASVDFRVESDNNQYMLYVDGADNRVGIGTSDPRATLEVYGSNPGLRITDSQTTITGGTALGSILFNNSDNSGGIEGDWYIANVAQDGFGRTDLEVRYYSNYVGDNFAFLSFDSNPFGVVINEDSTDMDFRVESNGNSSMLFLDGGDDYVGVGTTADWGGVLNVNGRVAFRNPNNLGVYGLVPTGWGYSPGAYGVIQIGQSGDNGGTVSIGYDPSGNSDGSFTGNGSEMLFANGIDFVTPNAADDDFLYHITMGDSGVVINENSYNLDFRIESDSNFAFFFADAGNGRIGINQDVPGYTLDIVGGTNSNSDGIALRPNNETQTAIYSFLGMKNTYYTQFTVDSGDTGSNAYFQFFAGTEDANGELLILSDSQTIFNNGQHDRDFQAESESNPYGIYVDALNNYTLMYTGNTSFSSGQGIKFNQDGIFGNVFASTSDAVGVWHAYSTGLGGFAAYMSAAGTLHARSTSITAISDATLKTNIRDLNTGLAEVMALQPRRFDWINDQQPNDVAGFIAQEMETVLPELVTTSMIDENETKKAIKMGDLIPTLVNAIKEQQATITDLETRIAALESN